MRRLRLVAGVSLAAIALGAGWHLLGPGARGAPAQAETPARPAPSVLTVKAPLPPGHILRPDDLAPVRWANGAPPPSAIIAGSAEAQALSGAVTRRAFAAGELLVPGSVIRPGERGFLAALVTPGFRAIAVSVDAGTAAGGLIWPGDRVDLILTQEIREEGVPLAQQVVSETILSDVRILSTDQKLEPAGDAAAGIGDKVEPRRVPTTVTLEVTPADAERVTVAATLGQLHLTLRGVAAAEAAPAVAMADVPAGGAAPAPERTWAGTVSPALSSVRARPPAALSAPPVAAAPAAPPRGEPREAGVRIYRGGSGA